MSNCKNHSDICAARPHDHDHEGHAHPHKRHDYVLYTCIGIITLAITLNQIFALPNALHHFAQACAELLLTMWWGVALGIIIVGAMSKMPRRLFTAMMGKSDGFSGLFRAVLAGVFLDLCCHGILLVASKLYERGVGLPQVFTFLIASPWNSFSLTLILISLVGLKWTLAYILGSVIIAVVTGYILQVLIRMGKISDNPNKIQNTEDDIPKFREEFALFFQSIRPSFSGFIFILKSGWIDGRSIIKWLLLGVVIAASINAFVPPDLFKGLFGPTLAGLFLTVVVATIIETCSEGSAPIAGTLFNAASAPGNAFAFLMAGVATDYTEIMVIREFTKSWKLAFLLPLLTVPQVIFIGWIMNMAYSP